MAEKLPPEPDFMAGRDLAVTLLCVADGFDHTDKAELTSQYREGLPQENFVLQFLEKLREKPELTAGFAQKSIKSSVEKK